MRVCVVSTEGPKICHTSGPISKGLSTEVLDDDEGASEHQTMHTCLPFVGRIRHDGEPCTDFQRWTDYGTAALHDDELVSHANMK